MTDTIRVVDLFCGCGGLTGGTVEALKKEAIDRDKPTDEFIEQTVDLVGINHAEHAVASWKQNYPWGRVYHQSIEDVDPDDIFPEDDPDVKLVSGGIECTHFSKARGGKPVSEQARMTAIEYINYIEKLRPDYFLVENVEEFADWGPVIDGQPTRDGSYFDIWIDALHSLGYNITWDVLNCADFGDPTCRDRLFILGSLDGVPEHPTPTHSESGAGDKDEWVPAAEIINWEDIGSSIFTRHKTNSRVTPPKQSTMKRIAEGLRRHVDGPTEQFASVLEEFGKDDIYALEERVIPTEYAEIAAKTLDGPFLVSMKDTETVDGDLSMILRQQDGAYPPIVQDEPLPTVATKGAHAVVNISYPSLVMPRNGAFGGLFSNSLYHPSDQPMHTITAKNTDGHIMTPSIVRWSHSGATLRVDTPMPTIQTEKGGTFSLSIPYLCPLYTGRATQRPRTRALDRPLMTIPASKSPAAISTPILQPFIDDFESSPKSLDEPLGTITTKDKFALCIPELWPWGIDIRYRMLQPDELAAAQGFPNDYEFVGTKTQRTELIGNAVPVNTAEALIRALLTQSHPTLGDFIDEETSVDTPDSSAGDSPTPGLTSTDDTQERGAA